MIWPSFLASASVVSQRAGFATPLLPAPLDDGAPAVAGVAHTAVVCPAGLLVIPVWLGAAAGAQALAASSRTAATAAVLGHRGQEDNRGTSLFMPTHPSQPAIPCAGVPYGPLRSGIPASSPAGSAPVAQVKAAL